MVLSERIHPFQRDHSILHAPFTGSWHSRIDFGHYPASQAVDIRRRCHPAARIEASSPRFRPLAPSLGEDRASLAIIESPRLTVASNLWADRRIDEVCAPSC